MTANAIKNDIVDHDTDLSNWDITELFADTIWAEYIDEEESDQEGMIKRGSLHIPKRAARTFYRLAKVILAGPKCSESVKPGAYLLLPPQQGNYGLNPGATQGGGLPGVQKRGKIGPNVFLREQNVMAIIVPREMDHDLTS